MLYLSAATRCRINVFISLISCKGNFQKHSPNEDRYVENQEHFHDVAESNISSLLHLYHLIYTCAITLTHNLRCKIYKVLATLTIETLFNLTIVHIIGVQVALHVVNVRTTDNGFY